MNADDILELSRSARLGPKPVVMGRQGAVVTSHPLAVRAGIEALLDGGSAVDAALTAAAVQLVVEPDMTSLTGGLSLLSRTADGETRYLNGNVHAPLAPLPGFNGDDLTGGRGVPVPGWWPAFLEASSQVGTLSVQRLLEPAIAIAEHGFAISAFLHGNISSRQHELGGHPQMREPFFPNGHLLEQGQILIQRRVAHTLRRLASEGDDYYLGDFARAFVAEDLLGGGVITPDDFALAKPEWAEPVTGVYRDVELVASAPPDDGGQMLAEALAILEHVDVASMGPSSENPATAELLIDVHNEVYYAPPRRGRPYDDPEFLAFLRSSEHALDRLRALGRPLPASALPQPGTIHISAVDADGNIASVTHSHMASGWVNGLFAEGFQLAGGGSFFQRGMPDPGAKAVVYLAPHIVLRDGKPILVGGSPSVSLVANVLQNVVNVVDFEMSIEDSIRAPRFGARPHTPERGWEPGVIVEAGFAPHIIDHVVEWANEKRLWNRVIAPWASLTGNYEGIAINGDLLRASADPRRPGGAEIVESLDGI